MNNFGCHIEFYHLNIGPQNVQFSCFWYSNVQYLDIVYNIELYSWDINNGPVWCANDNGPVWCANVLNVSNSPLVYFSNGNLKIRLNFLLCRWLSCEL